MHHEGKKKCLLSTGLHQNSPFVEYDIYIYNIGTNHLWLISSV